MNKVIYIFLIFTFCLCNNLHANENTEKVTNCGKNCVKLISEYYDKNISDELISKELETNKDELSSLKNLETCFKSVGLDCYAFQGNKEDYFISSSLNPVPEKIDFGFIDDFEKTSRHFNIQYVTDQNDFGLVFDPNVISLNKYVNCRLIEQKIKKDSFSKNSISFYKHNYVFEVIPLETVPIGDFEDTIFIKINKSGEWRDICLPVSGYKRTSLYSSPSRVIYFVKANEREETVPDVRLKYSGKINYFKIIEVRCEDKRLNVNLSKQTNENDDTIAVIKTSLNPRISPCIINDFIIVKYSEKKEVSEFKIPIKIIVAE